MIKLAIFNSGNLFLNIDIDFNNKNINVIERYNDTLLDGIFDGDITYQRIIYFINSRMKDFDINDLGSFIKYTVETQCKSFDDDITISIIK